MTTTTCPRVNCGKPLTAGLRYGPTPEPVPTMVCWECGHEDPPLGPCCEQQRELDGWRPCSGCGVSIQVRWYHRRYTSGNAYCSVSCYAKRQPLVTATCPCGVTFSRPPHRIKAGTRYCSATCQRALRPRRNAP